MKQMELAGFINQLNGLLLSCNALMCNNGVMENAGKIYGFNLLKIPSDKYKSGFYYAVRYKDENGKWLSTKKSTNTDNESLAVAFAIENKEKIIQEYKAHKKQLQKKNDGKDFYRMLEEYYTPNSKYLKNDYVNNKRFIPVRRSKELINVMKHYFIPFFKENKISSIQGVTNSVYSDLKIYLQDVKSKKGANLTTKCINTYLTSFNRILQYHERNEIISKLPYIKGMGMINLTRDDRINAKQPVPLPTNLLKGIFEIKITNKDDRENTLLYYTLSLFVLTTGIREKEIGNIRFTDIKYAPNGDFFYVSVYNHKTEHYNKTKEDDYRKIPLHPFVVEALEYYIKENNIKTDDYIFGTPRISEDTGKMEGIIHQSKFKRSIIYLYKMIKLKEVLQETGFNSGSKKTKELLTENIIKEMEEKNYFFNSLRHTFNTLCVLYRYNDADITRSDVVIDYFMGHRFESKIMANYTHINKADSKTFYDNYGKFVIDVLNCFIFYTQEEKETLEKDVEKFVDKRFTENKELLNLDGTIGFNTAMEKIIKPLVKKISKDMDKKRSNNTSIFLSE
jgi:integrase